MIRTKAAATNKSVPRKANDYLERRQVEDAFRVSQEMLAAELNDTRLLQAISSEIISEHNVQQLYEKIVDAAVSIMHSDFATMQIYEPEEDDGKLHLLAHRGLSGNGERYWEWVSRRSGSSCGESLRQEGTRVVITDIEECPYLTNTPELEMFRAGDIRASQSTPLKSRNGRLLGMISTHWKQPHTPTERDLRLLDILARQAADLLERRLTETELRRLNEHLEDLVRDRTADLLKTNEQLQGFAYSVAHDIRQQIRGIGVNASILLADAPHKLDQEEQATLNELVRNAKKLSSVVDDLLSYVRHGRDNPALVEVDLSCLAREIHQDLLERDCYPAEREVIIADGLVAFGDVTMLRIALQNLLENAAKYSAKQPKARIEVGYENGAFFVKDNGIGFDMSYVEKIFRPFERLHRDTEYQGNGIGLANVKRIIERHGGSLWAEATEGSGATFYFTLP